MLQPGANIVDPFLAYFDHHYETSEVYFGRGNRTVAEDQVPVIRVHLSGLTGSPSDRSFLVLAT